ncbi:DnaD domain-containing protein [Ktedonospora formicarum]|uniref:Primosomal replication protein N n=1 Tax=Ktedonospora formicarum TaxID=2778364 RepID=A0A8J3HTN6_9CHLR|nr:DnaD domain protein [Ktedonospora formicarum]GHO43787.1 primosomal replication protein N [Ktedonospora formicarum]
MTAFAGFPAGKNNPYVPIPEVFFTQLLPEIEDSAEIKVTLHLFWALAKMQGNPRCVSDRQLLQDQVLLHSLRRRGDPRAPEERLHQGLEQSVARGTLLCVHLRLVNEGNDMIAWYFFNTARSRKLVAAIEGGEMMPGHLLQIEEEHESLEQKQVIAAGEYPSSRGHAPPTSAQERSYVQVQVERPNIFALYEQNIGLLGPMIAQQLQEYAERLPPEWIEDAFREAVENNKRSWSYIRAILKRWETEGRQQWKA